MITIEEAKNLAFQALALSGGYDIDKVQDIFAILDDKTIEKEYGWVFSFVTRKYLETQDLDYALPMGMGPILIDKNGKAIPFGSGKSIEEWIAEYEAYRQKMDADG